MAVYLYLSPDGQVLEQVEADRDPTTAPEGVAPAYAWEPSRVRKASRLGDLARERWTSSGWRPDVEKIRARALAVIDAARLGALASLSSHPAHERKREELAKVEAAGAAAGLALPWLSQEALALGITIDEAVARVAGAVKAAETKAAADEAGFMAAKRRVRAASSSPAIDAVLAEFGLA